MEELAELAGPAAEASKALPIGALIAAGFAALMIFLNWKSSGLKNIKKRVTEYTTKKAEIAHEIVANDKRQAQLNVTFEKTEELTAEKEAEITAITEDAAEAIKISLAGTNLRATVNSISKKWGR